MNRINLFVAGLFIVFVLIANCSKDDDKTGTTTQNDTQQDFKSGETQADKPAEKTFKPDVVKPKPKKTGILPEINMYEVVEFSEELQEGIGAVITVFDDEKLQIQPVEIKKVDGTVKMFKDSKNPKPSKVIKINDYSWRLFLEKTVSRKTHEIWTIDSVKITCSDVFVFIYADKKTAWKSILEVIRKCVNSHKNYKNLISKISFLVKAKNADELRELRTYLPTDEQRLFIKPPTPLQQLQLEIKTKRAFHDWTVFPDRNYAPFHVVECQKDRKKVLNEISGMIIKGWRMIRSEIRIKPDDNTTFEHFALVLESVKKAKDEKESGIPEIKKKEIVLKGVFDVDLPEPPKILPPEILPEDRKDNPDDEPKDDPRITED